MKVSRTDKDFIQAIRDNQRGTAKSLYLQYREPFFNWARTRYTKNEEDLADAFQESVIVFYQNVQEGKITELRSSVKTYLFSIGKNVLLKRFEKQKRIVSVDSDNTPDFEDLDIDFEEKETLTHKQILLKEALNKLGDNCRKLLRYFYYQGFDNEEIALRMAYKNTDTVKSRKRSCMVKLEKILREEFKEELY